MKVLIVEDDLFVAMELDRIVETAGYEVVGIVATAEQALLQASRAEIALIDLNLADGSKGSALAARLIERFDTTVIFVTGHSKDVEGADAAVALIRKPSTDTQIVGALRKAIGRDQAPFPSVPRCQQPSQSE